MFNIVAFLHLTHHGSFSCYLIQTNIQKHRALICLKKTQFQSVITDLVKIKQASRKKGYKVTSERIDFEIIGSLQRLNTGGSVLSYCREREEFLSFGWDELKDQMRGFHYLQGLEIGVACPGFSFHFGAIPVFSLEKDF